MKKKLDFELSLFEKYFGHSATRSPYIGTLELSDNLTFGEYPAHAEYSNNVLLPKNLSVSLYFPGTEHGTGNSLSDTQDLNKYIESLMQELVMRAGYFSDERLLSNIFLTGPDSSRLSANHVDNILSEVATLFHLDAPSKTSVSVGIDAGICGADDVRRLAQSGISQFMVAVPASDQQSIKKAAETIEVAMSAVDSISVELSPHLYQNIDDYVSLLKRLIEAGVPNISTHNWWAGSGFDSNACLGRKLKIMRITQDLLADAGYCHLGLEQFSLLDEDTSRAATLRIPQHNDSWLPMQVDFDTIGVGLGAVSKFDTAVLANTIAMNRYRSSIEQKTLPIERGSILSEHDRLYLALVDQIFHQAGIDLTHSIGRFVGSSDSTTLAEYFADSLNTLQVFAEENLINETSAGFEVTELGRYFLTQIAANFCAPPSGKKATVVAINRGRYNTDR